MELTTIELMQSARLKDPHCVFAIQVNAGFQSYAHLSTKSEWCFLINTKKITQNLVSMIGLEEWQKFDPAWNFNHCQR
jgi:hypothetical protein